MKGLDYQDFCLKGKPSGIIKNLGLLLFTGIGLLESITVHTLHATDCSPYPIHSHHPEFWVFAGVIVFILLGGILWRSHTLKQLNQLQSAQAILQVFNAELNQEIRRRQQIEQKLRQSEANLAEAQQIARIGSWEFDLRTQKIVWSREMFILFGFDPDQPEPTYAEVLQCIHPEDRHRWQQTVETAMTTGTAYVIHHRVLLPDGSSRYIEGRGKAEVDAQGQVMRLVGTGIDITERKQVEIALQEKEEQLRLALDFTQIGMWDWHIQSDRLFWNENSPRLLNLPLDRLDVEVQAWLDRVHPDDRSRIYQQVSDALANRAVFEAEYRIVWLDGTVRWLLGKGQGIYDETGQAVRMVGVVLDITERQAALHERQQAETALQKLNQELEERVQSRTAALQQSEERFRQLAENISGVFWLLDLQQMQVLYVSPAYERIWGRTVESLYASGTSWVDAIHPDDRQHILLTLPRRYNTEFDQEYRIVQPSGEIRWIRDRAFPVVDQTGQVRRVAGLSEDITEHKHIAESLRQQRELLRTIFDNIPVMLTSYDTSGRITIANRAFEEILGWSTEELQNIDLIAALYPDPNEYQRVMNWMLEPRPGWCDFKTTVRDGRVLDTSWANIQLSDGRRIGIGQDITDRKRAEQEIQTLNAALSEQNRNLESVVEQRTAELLSRTRQLEATNRELESFSYSVSHDLRAPSRHIHGFVNVLRQHLEQYGIRSQNAASSDAAPSSGVPNAPLDARVSHYLDVIESSSRKMGLLIDGLLTLSRVGRRQMETRPVALRALVDEAIVSAQMDSTEERAIEFHIGDLPIVEGDAVLLQQVLVNLISNAIKFSRSADAPRVEIGSLPDHTVFVRDNGTGFAMEDADHIFDAFQRLHGREFEGTGIGLAIVQRIIHRHNGEVWVDSQPNQGATFYFRLNNPAAPLP